MGEEKLGEARAIPVNGGEGRVKKNKYLLTKLLNLVNINVDTNLKTDI